VSRLFSLNTLTEFAKFRKKKLVVSAQLVENHPYWDDLRTLLKDHPDMPEWDEDEDRAREDEDERQEEEEEEEMQG